MIHRPRLTAALLLSAGLAAGAQAATPQASSLTIRTGLFAAAADLAAEHSGSLPQATTAPSVADGTPAAGAAAAQMTPQAPASEHDPEKVAIGTQIFETIRLVEIATAGVKQGMSQDADFQKLSDADRQRFTKLVEEEILARKDIMDREMAEANVDRFTVDQLKVILRLAQLPLVQAMIMHGAGLAPEPTTTTMTADDQAVLAKYGEAPYVADFFEHTDFSPEAAELQIAVQNAFARFKATSAA